MNVIKIAYYSYDHVANPYCGGGGAYRDMMINTILSRHSEITGYYGNFKGARATANGGRPRSVFLGLSVTYAISRITYTLCASIHCLFVKADLIVICYSAFSPVLGFFFRRRKTVVELFHLVKKEPRRKYGVLGVFPCLFEKAALRGSKNIICINKELTDYISGAYTGKTIATIYTGFNDRLLSEKTFDGRYVLYFGRIDIHMKGIDILIDAFEEVAASFPDHRLLLAGRGSVSDTEWLQARIQSSPVKHRIVFRENVSEDEKCSLYANATLVCMPSRFEGWCIAAIEAAAVSKATIGTRIMGLGESIVDNETGLLVSPESSRELAGAMALLLRDEKLRGRLGENGYRRAQHFRWEEIAKAQDAFYRSVLQRARGTSNRKDGEHARKREYSESLGTGMDEIFPPSHRKDH